MFSGTEANLGPHSFPLSSADRPHPELLKGGVYFLSFLFHLPCVVHGTLLTITFAVIQVSELSDPEHSGLASLKLSLLLEATLTTTLRNLCILFALLS